MGIDKLNESISIEDATESREVKREIYPRKVDIVVPENKKTGKLGYKIVSIADKENRAERRKSYKNRVRNNAGYMTKHNSFESERKHYLNRKTFNQIKQLNQGRSIKITSLSELADIRA